MGYPPAKKKGGSQMRDIGMWGIWLHGNIISPRDSFETDHADVCARVDSDKEEDLFYLPTPAYKLIRATKKPKFQNPKRLPSTVITSHSFVP